MFLHINPNYKSYLKSYENTLNIDNFNMEAKKGA